MGTPRDFVAFAGHRLLARSSATEVVAALWKHQKRGGGGQVLAFDETTGAQTDFDLRGTLKDALDRLAQHPLLAPDPPPRTGPGRPRLGVISRDISLLPRHWEWLEAQPGGLSATLRRLVDEARKQDPEGDRARQARDSISRLMWALAGDLPGFEEATRALFAPDPRRVAELIDKWPRDLRDYLLARLPAVEPRDIDTQS